VLIVVLWASLGLVSVALLFGHSMLMAYRGSDNDLAGRQAEQAIEGAARYAESLLTNATTPGALPDELDYENEAVPVGEATFWFLGRSLDTTDSNTRFFGLVDEASKLNLNSPAVDANVLMNLPGMTTDLAAAIVEWRSPGTPPTDTNTTSASSSISKQAPFESVEELALVQGATREILYGEDANMNGVLDPNEDDSSTNLPNDNGDGKLDPGILEYLTVFSRESNMQKDGTTTRVDFNTGGTALTDLLKKTFPNKSDADVELIAAAGADATAVNSLLAFYIASGLTEDEFGQIAYELTCAGQQAFAIDEEKKYLTGLINVNTASETVLTAILDANQASAIVTARLNRTQPDANFAWVADALGLKAGAQFPPTLNLFTGKTSQVTADIAAVGRHGRGWRRTKMVIDNSTGKPRIVYRRNLAPLGWALGSDIRAELAQMRETR
jgi:DNA uptake protein ComE-like DNA-binding protein